MNNIWGRNNIIKRTYDDKDVFIYEDHRTILNILWEAKQSGRLIIPPTIVCFDRHDDFKDPKASTAKISQLNSGATKIQEFWNFVEWEISPMDDDWIKTGMELNLIGNVILIGAEIDPNLSGTVNKYTDTNGSDHYLYSVGHIWGGFAHQGWLVDRAQSRLYQPLWDLLGWDNNKTNYNFNSSLRKAPLVLDFDLDCFSTKHLEFTIAWREDIFFSQFTKPVKYDYTSQHFLIQLFQESSFTTIARESECFSHINESAYVFNYINEILFNNQL